MHHHHHSICDAFTIAPYELNNAYSQQTLRHRLQTQANLTVRQQALESTRFSHPQPYNNNTNTNNNNNNSTMLSSYQHQANNQSGSGKNSSGNNSHHSSNSTMGVSGSVNVNGVMSASHHNNSVSHGMGINMGTSLSSTMNAATALPSG